MSFIADILGANSAAKGQKQAAAVAQSTSDASLAEQRRQYDQSRADFMPYLTGGTAAFNRLLGLYGLGGGGTQNGYAVQNVSYPTGQQAMTPDQAVMSAGVYPSGVGRFEGNPLAEMSPIAYGGGFGLTGAVETPYSNGQYGAIQTTPQTPGTTPSQSATGMETFWQSPDYQFRLNESMRGLNARNAALGIQDSGAAQKAALTLAGNQASGEWNNYVNRLSALAGVGQTTAQNNAALGQNYAGAVTGINSNLSQALGSSYINRGNIRGNLYSNLGGQAEQIGLRLLTGGFG